MVDSQVLKMGNVLRIQQGVLYHTSSLAIYQWIDGLSTAVTGYGPVSHILDRFSRRVVQAILAL